MKVVLMLALFAVAVLVGWAIHPVLGVVIAVLGYGALDGMLTK